MENAETILVIFLSTFLAIFLTLAVIATVKLIKVLNHLERIGQKAEAITDKAEAAIDLFSVAAVPSLIGKAFSAFSDTLSRKSKSK